MYLYMPMDGRSIVVGDYTISGTGMQFDVPEECLEKVLGTLLTCSKLGESKPTEVVPTPVMMPIVAEK